MSEKADMDFFWANITEGQGAVLSSIITVAAAGLGIIVGYLLFNGRVLNLKDAIERSEEMLTAYRADMDSTLEKLSADLLNFQRMTQESLNQVSLSVDDLQSAQPAAVIAGSAANDEQEAASRREELRQAWYPIRDQIEHLATDPALNQTLRNKYAHMDRRAYMSFIDAMIGDGVFGSLDQQYREAASLWQGFRSGRSTPSPADVDLMKSLNAQLLRR